jgi:PAS domain-containing protein
MIGLVVAGEPWPVYPALVGAALVGDAAGTALAVLACIGVAVVVTLSGIGPFVGQMVELGAYLVGITTTAAAVQTLARGRRAGITAGRVMEQRFRTLVENLPGVVYVDTIEGQRVDEARRNYENALRTRTPRIWEYPMLTKAGERRWVQERMVPVVEPDGSVRTMLGLMMDFTEAKHASVELE